ncbi:MAG: U32 family peptidase [Oscillospiraceae bacterium]|nr:U32 family peptidase [Oscillospiraceae bacterium]
MKATQHPVLELLSPAGDMERLDSALQFGADAVYLAGQEFGMRTAPSNFTMDKLREAVEKAHRQNVRVYLTCNTLPRNEELSRLPEFLQYAQQIGIDALIVADLGVMKLAQQNAPRVDLHMSTQTGIVNYASANALYELGAKRIVVARELSLEEISGIRAKVPSDLEIEAFVHGAMCVSFSGRCLLSAYLNNRDANRGDCSQPCRWEYSLVEKNRPGEQFDINEDSKGTYILNSRDMCMIDHIPELAEAGVTSLKIEGRAKSAYYVAVTTHAYRAAIDAYYEDPKAPLPKWIPEELHKISHREYSTGFYFGNEPGQVLENGGYVREYDVVAVCEDYQDGVVTLSQRNKFLRGDTLDVLEVGKPPYLVTLDTLYDADGQAIDSAPHATMIVKAPCKQPIAKGAVLRKARTPEQYNR